MAASTKVSDMCRLCGTDTLNVVRHHIFEGEGQVKKSAQKISECLPLHIAAEDPLPKNICGECSYKLDLMSDFREKAVKTDVMLVSLVEGVKPEIPDDDDDGPDHEIDNDFRSDTPVEQPEQQTEPEVLIKEEEAQQPQQPEKRPGRKAANKRPIQESDMEEEEEEAPAKKRGRKPKEKETAPAASATTSASTNPPKENTGEKRKRDEKAVRCDVCRAKHANAGCLARHMLCEHREFSKLKCEQCGKRLWCRGHMRRHWRAHLQVLVYSHPCSECPKAFKRLRSLRQHIKVSHPDKAEPRRCRFCLLAFSSTDKLEYHERKHTGERPFVCATCGNAYISDYALKQHERLHDPPEDAFTCEICGKCFAFRNYLTQHRKIHFAEARTEKCHLCGWSTYSRAVLKNHLLTHSGEKNVTCEQCGRSFAHKALLHDHRLRMHSDTKPSHLCTYCGKTFATGTSLRRHIALHQGLRPHECTLCGTTFAQRYTLRTHQWLVHKVLPYKCDKCDQSFKLKNEMQRHRVHAHLTAADKGDDTDSQPN
ncbi:zinc finger protein OZF-like isoform X20 [Cloeon dipterum]|uniref:zinc finger protein OZF-like isoform X20 n=1 Tax=Cloeon dipterum TaxID=197152 RepID=UPI00321FE4A5